MALCCTWGALAAAGEARCRWVFRSLLTSKGFHVRAELMTVALDGWLAGMSSRLVLYNSPGPARDPMVVIVTRGLPCVSMDSSWLIRLLRGSGALETSSKLTLSNCSADLAVRTMAQLGLLSRYGPVATKLNVVLGTTWHPGSRPDR